MQASDINSLRKQLKAAGVYQHHELQVWLRLGLLLSTSAACVVGLVLLPMWCAFLLIPVLALSCTTTAMLGHEGIHGSFSSKRWQNRSLTLITYPFLSGLSAVYWKHKHDNLHHGHPNVHSTDPDVDIWPMASTKEDFERSKGLQHWFQRHVQGYAFWPLTMFLGLIMRFNSLRHLGWHARNRRINAMWYLDLAALAAHYVLWFVGGTLLFGVGGAIIVYVSTWAIVGVLLALIFAPAHIGLPITSGQNRDWLHQLETTRNMETPRGTKWFFVGLDYQIEHHLFPKIAHQELPKARDITRRWCQQVGVPHQEVSYAEALRSATVFVRDAWKTPCSSPEEIRALWQPPEPRESVAPAPAAPSLAQLDVPNAPSGVDLGMQ